MMGNEKKDDPDARLAMVLLRSLRGWRQGELARAAGIGQSQLSVYDRGERALPREILEKVARAAEFPIPLIDPLLRTLRLFRTAATGKARVDRVLADAAAFEVIALIRSAADVILASRSLRQRAGSAIGRRPTRSDRKEVVDSWERMLRRTPEQRRVLVEDVEEFHSWALCERVAAESIEAAANHPGKALELGGLALRMAELAPGEAAWRSRLQGYAWAHLANARRVNSDLPGADEAMARAWKLWQAGAAADSGLLNPAWLPWIDSVLRMDQRRFPEALRRIEEALEIDQGELRGRILLGKSSLLQVLGDAAGSTATLLEAAPLIDADSEPRAAFGLRFNLLLNLCHVGRAAEAEPRLPEIRELAERMGEELDLVRVLWLEGKVGAGLGRTEAARGAFEQVRREFTTRQIAFDCALASLDLALLLLDEGRIAEVRTLAGEMLWIFRSQGVHREALAALRVFCDAAKRETATAELARRVIAFLYRAQDDPELRFQATTPVVPKTAKS